ncbi:DinB family protein [Paenibacillus sp. RC67]|uniref:DinB family protein n=1 Tax=Paenibacillus sp. RC67 TaxID=3039392 RepID=UPI0024AC8DCB|nr:DinB family protein [Paenibacillus sp. RC67]
MSQTVIDLTSYTRTLDQLKEAIKGLSEEQLKRKEAPDKWSVTEVLSHLADHSIVFSFRIRKVISENDVQLAAFQQDPWVSHSRANESSADDILAVFGALLAYNSLLFKRLSADDWQKSGVNVKGDTVTLESSYRAFIQHVQTHLAQIERIKRGL